MGSCIGKCLLDQLAIQRGMSIPSPDSSLARRLPPVDTTSVLLVAVLLSAEPDAVRHTERIVPMGL